MDLTFAIQTRRSVRRYEDRPLPEDTVRAIVEAGFHAPSAHDLHPLHFIVVRDKEQLLALSRGNRYASMVAFCAAAVVVCGDRDIQQNPEFLLADSAAATQNILLQAHALGIGAVWCGVVSFDDWCPDIRSLLSLPANILPFSVVPLGYAQKQPAPVSRADAERVHLDRW